MAACAPPPPQLAVAPIKAPGAQAPVIEQGRVVKFNLTVDPSRDDSRPVMTQSELESAHRVYIKLMGAPPAPHEPLRCRRIRIQRSEADNCFTHTVSR
eukprot:3349032-Amphidinium_carterae.2